MAYESKPGDISLFENEKGGNEKAPDHRGYVLAHRDIKAGEKLEISLWNGKAGSSRTFGGKLADLRERKAEPTKAPTPRSPSNDEEEFPF
jgi:hypothetical protein